MRPGFESTTSWLWGNCSTYWANTSVHVKLHNIYRALSWTDGIIAAACRTEWNVYIHNITMLVLNSKNTNQRNFQKMFRMSSKDPWELQRVGWKFYWNSEHTNVILMKSAKRCVHIASGSCVCPTFLAFGARGPIRLVRGYFSTCSLVDSGINTWSIHWQFERFLLQHSWSLLFHYEFFSFL